jgi:hypothetical protein
MAYILDIYLELKVKDWGRAMVDPKRTRSYGVFCGKRLCVKSLVEAITGVIPDSDITDMKGTVRKHVGRSIVAIMNGSIGLADFSTREQKYAYRTLYGLCVTTINTKSTVELTTVTRGSSSSRAEKSAVLFQQTAPLPPGLTKEDFVHCLEVCWEERKESSPLRKN